MTITTPQTQTQTATAAPLSALQYAILRSAAEGTPDSGAPLTQIDIHRAVARYPDSAPTATYNSIRRLRDRGLVAVTRNVPGRPQASAVRLTDLGRSALRGEQAKMGGAR